METWPGDRSCLICLRVTLGTSSVDSENLAPNASLLQDFFNCFHINVLDSHVNDLSTSSQFCPTCEQFLVEWSSTQTQMAQLTRRAAQLKATLSALLLTAPQIQEKNHDEDATEMINNRIQNSQYVELPLLLQQTVDDISNELRRKYLVNVMVSKVQLQPTPRNITKKEFAPFSVRIDNKDEPMDDWRGNDDSDAEHLPNEAKVNDVETSEQIPGMRIKTEGVAYSDDFSQDSVDPNPRVDSSVHDMSDKMTLPPVLKLDPLQLESDSVDEAWDPLECDADVQLPVAPKVEPLPGGHDKDDEPWEHEESGDDDSDEEYLPNEHEEFSSDDSRLQDSVDSIEMNVKTGKKRKDKLDSKQPTIPDGPNRFKYQGMSFKRNEEDQTYTCDACGFKSGLEINAMGAFRYYVNKQLEKARICDACEGYSYKVITKLQGMDQEDLKYGTKEEQAGLLNQVLSVNEIDLEQERLPGERPNPFAKKNASLASLSGADDAVYREYKKSSASSTYNKHPLFKKFRAK